MKYILLLLSFSLSLLTLAQTPKTISYQGVARNATGQPIPNQPIKIKLSLLETATSTNSLYTETHSLTTTGQGLFAVQIGAGTVLTGTYATLDWSNGPKFVKTEIDPIGGDNFTLSSTNPLNAVPFALFAQSGTPGPQGPAGANGAQGPIGLTGPAGPTGPQGPIGLTGPQGSSGAVGPQGVIGLTGPAGAVGPQGPVGQSGATGATGAQGPIGLTGPQGLKGDTGARGPIGPQGTFPSGNTVGDMQFWNGTQWTMIPKGQPGTTLKNCDGQITWAPCKPSISTNDATSITGTTLTSGGNISNDGDSPVTVRGVCYSTTPNPTLANFKTMDGSGIGSFSRGITGLPTGTTFYIRAYATNSIGTAYGNQIVASTLTLATLTTIAATGITSGKAISGGNITSDGGSTITSRGVVWGTTANPTISGNKTIDGTGSGTFNSNLSSLIPNTTYHVRAYAISAAGTSYGNEITFTTLPSLIIGQDFGGGKIAYIFQPNDPGYVEGEQHGLIAPIYDQSSGIDWGCIIGIGGTGSAIGDGYQNTTAMLANNCNGAASVCMGVTINGYSDWFLPSINELAKMIENKGAIGGMFGVYYWSSTEYGNSFANYLDNTGVQSGGSAGKGNTKNVRAARYF